MKIPKDAITKMDTIVVIMTEKQANIIVVITMIRIPVKVNAAIIMMKKWMSTNAAVIIRIKNNFILYI
ncbi:MAG TPA: hypothetical protein DCS83_00065 [Prevotella sp.]|nr:hypothetical protein [Prevotella sp.]